MKKMNLLVISSMLFSTMILGPVSALAETAPNNQEVEVTAETISSTINPLAEIEQAADAESEASTEEFQVEATEATENLETVVEEEVEVPQEKIAKGTRAVASVSNYTEFATAMRTASVTEINITDTITATANIASIPVRDLVINGNGKKIIMSSFSMSSFVADGGSLTFKDLTLEGYKGEDPLIIKSTVAWDFTFENVNLHYGTFDVATSNVYFAGKSNFELSKAGRQSAAFKINSVKNFEIKDNSEFNMVFTKPHGSIQIGGTDTLTIGKNATVNFGKNAVSVPSYAGTYGFSGFKTIFLRENSTTTLDTDCYPFHLYGSNMTVEKGATLKNISPGVPTMLAYYSSVITFEPGSSYISKTASHSILLHVGSVLTFDQMKELNIENTENKNVIWGGQNTQINIKNLDLTTWLTTTSHDAAPNYIWENLELSGKSSSNTTFRTESSNNVDATANFHPYKLSKYNGKGHGYIENVTVSIDEVSDKDQVVSGTATPNAAIQLTIDGDKFSGKANASGNYSIDLGKTYPGGTVIDAVASLSDVTGTATTTVLDKTAPKAPTLNALKDTSTQASGKAEANATVILTVDGYEIGRGQANGNGDYTITIPAQKENTKVSAQAVDAANNGSDKTAVIVSGTAIDDPTIENVTDQDTAVNGKAPANSKITLTIPMPTGGEMTYRGDVDADGNYSIKIGKQKEGTEITVVATKDGKTSGPVSTIVIGTILDAPTLNNVTDQDSVVTGKAPAQADVIVTISGQTYEGKANENGTYSITIPKQKAGTVIEAVAKQDGKTSSVVSTTVTDNTAPGAPTIEDLTEDSTVVKGQAEAGSTVILTVNGKEIGRGQADKDGNYSIAITPQAAGDVVKATATDEAGNQSKENSTTVQAVSQTGTITTNDYEVKPAMDAYITGTFTGSVKSLLTSVERNGVVTEFAGGALNSDGTYQIYAWNKIQTVNDKVIVYGLDKNGNRIAQAPVTVKDNTIPVVPGKVSFTKVEDYILGSSTTIKAEYEGSVAYMEVIVDGKTYRGGTLKDQTVSFYAWDKIHSTTLPVEMIAYSTDGSILARTDIKVVMPMTIGTIMPDSFNYKTQTFVTGSYTGDVKKVNLVVDGVTYTGGSVKDGKVNFYAWNKITNDKQVVELVALDATGKELDRQLVPLEEVVGKGTITPAVFTVGTDGYLTGTYTGDVKAVRLVVDGVSYAGGSVVDGKISFYAFDKIRSTNQEVFIEGYDVSGNQIYSTKVTVNEPLSGKLSLTPFNFAKDTSIKGNYTGQVASLKTVIDGVEVIGGILKDGELSIYVWNKIPSKGSNVEVIALAKNGKELDRQTLVIQ